MAGGAYYVETPSSQSIHKLLQTRAKYECVVTELERREEIGDGAATNEHSVTLAPFGPRVYVRAGAISTERLLVLLGESTFAEYSRAETIAHLKRRMTYLDGLILDSRRESKDGDVVQSSRLLKCAQRIQPDCIERGHTRFMKTGSAEPDGMCAECLLAEAGDASVAGLDSSSQSRRENSVTLSEGGVSRHLAGNQEDETMVNLVEVYTDQTSDVPAKVLGLENHMLSAAPLRTLPKGSNLERAVGNRHENYSTDGSTSESGMSSEAGSSLEELDALHSTFLQAFGTGLDSSSPEAGSNADDIREGGSRTAHDKPQHFSTTDSAKVSQPSGTFAQGFRSGFLLDDSGGPAPGPSAEVAPPFKEPGAMQKRASKVTFAPTETLPELRPEISSIPKDNETLDNATENMEFCPRPKQYVSTPTEGVSTALSDIVRERPTLPHGVNARPRPKPKPMSKTGTRFQRDKLGKE
ncbi:hypothetical protein FVE85_2255 [Porphyridium purpureum]|uniref:Uncharacterized protein n=1 Tax=Porphyridium purpureum TaxID=35688 RepID=A0A5J4YYP5_PORPP|nr:hypothetical protein FVE85_2255 [Porphyridium purpureum]|eukprot:POR7230..scf209_3